MNATPTVTRDQFIRRLTNLCVRSGLAGFPKDDTDQHILFKSALLILGGAPAFSEKEINDRLALWTLQVCEIKNFDRVTLRRYLIDAGYLTRSSDGATYHIAQPGPRPGYFDASIDQVDVVETIRSAREEAARRKAEYLNKSKGV
jgi:hypothetical protein